MSLSQYNAVTGRLWNYIQNFLFFQLYKLPSPKLAEVRTECNKRLEKVGLKIEKRTSETSGKKEFVLITLIQDAGKMLCQDPSLKYEDFMPYARGNIFKHFPSGSSHKADENLMMCPRRFIDLLKIHLFSEIFVKMKPCQTRSSSCGSCSRDAENAWPMSMMPNPIQARCGHLRLPP